MSRTTPGTLLLEKLGIAFELHPYNYDPDVPRVGLAAADALGIDPSQTFKTLMAELDGRPVCAVIPADAELSMKKLAACLGGKSAAMMKVPDAERLTGYKAPSARSARCRQRWTRLPNSTTGSTSMPASADCCCRSRRRTP
jgi:Cys-tRNA(Pro)/Cys-tRNA(Cys) deacylase